MQSHDPLVETLYDWLGIFRRQLMGNYFIFARDKGLTMAQFGTMLRIHHRGACGVSDIGSILGVTNSAASQMLERLVQLELVSRTEDPTDRRVKQIGLTDKGRQILQESSLVMYSWLDDLAQGLSEGERGQIRDALHILIDKARQLEVSLN